MASVQELNSKFSLCFEAGPFNHESAREQIELVMFMYNLNFRSERVKNGLFSYRYIITGSGQADRVAAALEALNRWTRKTEGLTLRVLN